MKILITSALYYPRVGGVEIVTQSIAEYFAMKGYEVWVATSYLENRKIKNLNGVNILEFNIVGNRVKGIKELKEGDIQRYKKLLLDGGFDIIFQYAVQTWHTDLMFEIIDKVKPKKILAPCGYSGLTTFLRKFIYYRYFKSLPRYLSKYDLLIYHSKEYLDYKFGKKHRLNKYKIIPNGINLNEFMNPYQNDRNTFREKYGITSKYTILNVSNHYIIKGHNFAIKVLEGLLKKENNISLIIIGDAPFGTKRSCYNDCLVYSKNNNNFKLLSGIPRNDIIKAYNESDLFFLSSDIECFPLVILESMAAGIPYVSKDVGCVRNMGKGIIIHSVKESVQAIQKLIFNKKFRNHLVKFNRSKVINEYEINKVLKQYEKTFNEILSLK